MTPQETDPDMWDGEHIDDHVPTPNSLWVMVGRESVRFTEGPRSTNIQYSDDVIILEDAR